MPGCEEGSACLVDADEVGLGTSEWIELGKSGVVVLLKSKAIVDTMPTDCVGIFTLVSPNVRESAVEMVDVRVRVSSMTGDVDIWF